ncbi:hydroxymethylglutaryl-CoA synthase family protein [Streptomyces sp. ODS05-4]|uniref:hydroxymethylglutaryl-CoA synthase family protein n=1 Tax=Streptomyces sp. ODS05-4 TaxID=2944939 RepID=UPI002109F71B|nr:hydroxymethylglutaryl-CoA synthase [Streptomyces sp. ODS05-4]
MRPIGIEGLNAYCGLAYVPVRDLFEGRGLDPDRVGNLMADHRSVLLPWEDPVTNAVNAAKPLVDALGEDAARIELLVTSTESGVDFSKSVASYAHRYLGLSPRCRIMEVKAACYGTTGMLQLAAGYLAGQADPGAKALVIGTDISPMDERARYAEPTMGNGAVAVLVSDEPRVLSLDGPSGLHSFEVMDTARPAPDLDFVNPDRSLLSYLECLTASYRDYLRQAPETDFTTSFDHLVMHTPFPGMVKAAHRKLMRDIAPAAPAVVEADFARRVVPSLTYARTVGNLCSGSIYLALASLVDHGSDVEGARVGLYSYGSGCASEFFSGTLAPGAREALAAMGIGERVRARRELTFAEYEKLLPAAVSCLVPQQYRSVDLSDCDAFLAPLRSHGPALVLTGVEDFHRVYAWR